MNSLMLINPKRKRTAPKKRRAAQKGAVMARKKRGRKRAVRRAAPAPAAPRRRRRRNPASPRKSGRRRAISRMSGAFGGLKFKEALRNLLPMEIGMFGAKMLSKRFGGGADQTDPESWTWRSYLQMAAGAVGTAWLAGMVKQGWSQKALEGGLALLAYEIIQNELIASSDWGKNWLGEDGGYQYDEIPAMMGSNGVLPLDEVHRAMPELSGSLEPVTRSLGDFTAQPGSLGGDRSPAYAAYRSAYNMGR